MLARTIVNLMKDDVCWRKPWAQGRGRKGEGGGLTKEAAKFEQFSCGQQFSSTSTLFANHSSCRVWGSKLMNKRQVKQGS